MRETNTGRIDAVARIFKHATVFTVVIFLFVGGAFASIVAGTWIDVNIVTPKVGYTPLLSLSIRIGSVLAYAGLLSAIFKELESSDATNDSKADGDGDGGDLDHDGITLDDAVNHENIAGLVYELVCPSCRDRVEVEIEVGESPIEPIECPNCGDVQWNWDDV